LKQVSVCHKNGNSTLGKINAIRPREKQNNFRRKALVYTKGRGPGGGLKGKRKKMIRKFLRRVKNPSRGRGNLLVSDISRRKPGEVPYSKELLIRS